MVLIKAKFRDAGHVERLKYHGVFDYDNLLQVLRDWIVEQQYELIETKVKHKVPTPAGAEHEIIWDAWRKINGYIKFWIQLHYRLYDLKEVEVIKDGKKKKLTKGRVFIEFTGRMDIDYSNRFYGSKFMQTMQDFFHKYIIKKALDGGWSDELYYRILKIYKLAKETLEMDTAYNAAEARY